jgi:pimeloyl-ACP methyl ester carboxylesterase
MPFADNNGVRIYYEVEGSGPPLLLHHGLLGDLESWRSIGYVDELSSDYTLVLFDARGHGRSDKPRKVDAYHMEGRVGDVEAVLDAAGIARTHFFGYSLGAQTGFGLAKYAPHRLHSLVLGGARPQPWHHPLVDEMISGFKWGIRLFVKVIEKRMGGMDPATRKRWLANDARALRANLTALRDDPGFEDVLGDITTPCFAFVGENDAWFKGMREGVTRMPSASFMPLPGLDHTQVLRRHDLILPPVKDFLARVPV